MPALKQMRYLEDRWSEPEAQKLAGNPLSLLRYRSNLLGSDLRITNFGGGNTSSKITLPDPFTGSPVRVLAVKGSGGDLGSITESGFALLYLDRLEQLKEIYRGDEHEDEMLGFYPLAAFGANRVAASIDTPLHAFLPFSHVDHVHPDWGIALAASANGREKLEDFNAQFARKLLWLPWQRPGFELSLLMANRVKETPGAQGIVLAGHGLFTWGATAQECYANSVETIDQLGTFVHEHQASKPTLFGGLEHVALPDRAHVAVDVLPALRGALSSNQRVVAHWVDDEPALTFAGSKWAPSLAALGTSCPDHFLRTRVCPMFVPWDPATGDVSALKLNIRDQVVAYRKEYTKYYNAFATAQSPPLRDSNPSVVIIPGLGLFSFGKNKKEARITAEFFVNAIHVMAGANALEGADVIGPLPQARNLEQSGGFRHFHNYVALPRSEAFRIEYWTLEEAKLKRMPPEEEFSRRIALVIGGASGIGRQTALLLARKGAHVVVADYDADGAARTAQDAAASGAKEFVISAAVDLSSRESVAAVAKLTVKQFGGLDIVINSAAIYPLRGSEGELSEAMWAKTFLVNVTGNYLLGRETEWIFKDQQLPATVVLTGSANAVVPKHGSEAYDTSKAALHHLIRELAIKLGPLVRVNGVAPATVVAGSTMFPRDRVIESLKKYRIPFSESESTDSLRAKLADFYAQRTLTKSPILPQDCAEAILWLAGEHSAKTTGHVIPVDGGLSEAFMR
jgi:rhamnulose-1-phosphate aldolase/alcohol dehydrogenase